VGILKKKGDLCHAKEFYEKERAIRERLSGSASAIRRA